jgi:hypothetical protein
MMMKSIFLFLFLVFTQILGAQNFTEVVGTPFDGVDLSSIAFSDVDNDGDEDLIITGRDATFTPITKLYTNDGTGSFSEEMKTPFDSVGQSFIAFSDVDNDGDEDLVITGLNTSAERITKLYTNDGQGNFTEVMGTPFEGVKQGSIAFSDVDNDGDEDLIITGRNASEERIAKLYINEGAGNFIEVMGTPFDGVALSSIAFSDVDGDGDEDLLITGLITSTERIAKLYTNDGTGSFAEVTGTPFDGVDLGSIAFADVDGDTYPDLLITGQNNSSDRIAKLYINDGVTNSTEDFIPGFDLELKAYPNPTSSNRVNLRFESTEIGYAQLGVYDVNGHLLRTHKELTGIGKQTLSMDIASLPPGSYFIQLDTGKRKGTVTLVVQ